MLKHVHFFVFKKLLLKVCIAYIYIHVTVDIFFFFTIIIDNVNEKNTYIYNKKKYSNIPPNSVYRFDLY